MNEVRVLPSDMWLEILRRIPAADLFPLKAVSKTFYRLISDDVFTQLHLNDFSKLHPNPKRAIISTEQGPTPPHSNYYDPDKRTIGVGYDESRFNDWCTHVCSTAFGSLLPQNHIHWVLDSYHGLLLVDLCNRLLLCNPITRSYKFLPLDPSCIWSQMDFGSWKIAYDDVSNQYRVFRLKLNEYKPPSLRVDSTGTIVTLVVFDVHGDGETHLPRIITTKAIEVGSDVVHIMESVLVNGSVYWLILTGESGNLGNHIVSANVTAEKVKTRTCSISMPFIILWTSDFCATNETFYHLEQPNYETNYKNRLWVLEGFESENANPSWTMKHIIDTNHLTSTTPNFDMFCHIVGVFCNKVLFLTRSLQSLRSNVRDDRLFQYDMSSKEFEEVVVTNCGNDTHSEFLFAHIVGHIDSVIRF